MVVMINGSFGAGKSTVAKLLRNRLPGSIIYDPERVGFVLSRLPKWIRLKGMGTDDYQHMDLWRWCAVAGVRVFRVLARGPVIVPMAFSDRDYFDEIVAGIRRFDGELRVFCLRASVATAKQRLVARGDRVEGAGSEWIARRVVECVDAHRDPHFGEPVETDGRPAGDVAEEIRRRLQVSSGSVPSTAPATTRPSRLDVRR